MFHSVYACSTCDKQTVGQQLQWGEMELLYIAVRLGKSNCTRLYTRCA